MRREARGAVEPPDSAVIPSQTPAYAFSPRIHAPGTRVARLGQLGAREETPAPSEPELAPVLVVCTTCRQPIRRNEVLGISFCPVHGLSQPFTFIPFGQKRLREV